MENFARKLQPYTKQAGFLALRSSRNAPSHMLIHTMDICVVLPDYSDRIAQVFHPIPFSPTCAHADALETLIWNLYTMQFYHPPYGVSSHIYKNIPHPQTRFQKGMPRKADIGSGFRNNPMDGGFQVKLKNAMVQATSPASISHFH